LKSNHISLRVVFILAVVATGLASAADFEIEQKDNALALDPTCFHPAPAVTAR
jgi:hypothetical protein